MIVAIVFAHVWGILQLIVLGSFARTVRVRTALMAMAAGLYACAAAALLLEFAWITPTTWITGAPLSNVILTASYTIDPFIEELVKITPLALLLLATRVVRRQWSITDCVIVGAALGSGFGLAEELYRYTADTANAVWSGGGWLLHLNFATVVTVPGPFTTMTSWLPAGAVERSLFSYNSAIFYALDVHTAWSALAGFAVGLLFLDRGARRRRVAIILLLYVGIDHAFGNAALNASSSTAVAISSSFLRPILSLLPLVALAIGWWLDNKRQSTKLIPELALEDERKASAPAIGTLRTAFSQAPWSVAWVDTLVRMRRAYASERRESSEQANLLRILIVAFRDRIDRAVAHPIPSSVGAGWARAKLFATLRQPTVFVGLIIIMPSILWFVVSGVPATAWFQGLLLSRPAWAVIRLFSLFALAWTAWNVVLGLHHWVQIARWPVADLPASFLLRALAGAGTLALGGYAFFLSMTHGSPYGHMINVHIGGAVSKLTPGVGQLLASSGPLLSSGGVPPLEGPPSEIPPTLPSPYAPPGTPEPPPFVPDIPVTDPLPPGPGFPDPIPPGPITLPSGTVPAEVAATTGAGAILPWLTGVAAAAALLTYSSPTVSEGEEQRMLEDSKKIQQEREHRPPTPPKAP